MHYEEVLGINKELGREAGIATDLNNIGSVYDAWGNYHKALHYYKQALERESFIASNYNNIGIANFSLKRYTHAKESFVKSIQIKEKIRKTAQGAIRRDYLASELYTYQHLINTYHAQKDIRNIYSIIELSRAKLLAEELAHTENIITVTSADEVMRQIPHDAVLLAYANMAWNNKISIVITHDRIKSFTHSDTLLFQSVLHDFNTQSGTGDEPHRGIVRVASSPHDRFGQVESLEGKTSFDQVVNLYRTLISHPSPKNRKHTEELSRIFYKFLIKPFESIIKDKNKIIIITDHVLAYIPFETLQNESGNYLAETHHVTYIQSMGVMNLIKNRTRPRTKKPLLAVGGAVYNQETYNDDVRKNNKRLEYFSSQDSTTRGSLRSKYEMLGYSNWPNLPGTLREVQGIAKIIGNAVILTGSDATEQRIKILSNKGELAQFKVLHFATHGVVVPEAPELSALVLSQLDNSGDQEDGYLRMSEIAQLHLNADFVNLSACETGLGKLYGGEGIVGLTQAFLIAGANSVLVSLWQVADISTMKFMVELYSLVKNKGIDYAQAITQVKRKFINGNFGKKYKQIYYWGPFIYYGKM